MSRAERRAKITPEGRARGARLRTERDHRGWGRRELARLLLDAIDDRQKPSHVTVASHIKEWEDGGGISAMYRTAYATVFDLPEAELFAPTQATPPLSPSDSGEVRAVQELSQPYSTDPMGTVGVSPVPDFRDDDMRRRAALQLLAALGAGTAIPPGSLEGVLSGIDDALGNPLDLDEWERTVHEYGQLLITRPAGALTRDLTSDIITVGELLRRQLAEPERQRMLRVSAGLSACLAINLGDRGDIRAVRTAWATAIRAADACGDTDLRVWVRGRAAQEACWTGRPTSTVVALADEAVTIADGGPSAGLARAHAARAYAAVAQGDTAQAYASLAKAKRTFDGLPHQDGQSVFAFRQSQLRWTESYVHALSGDRRAHATVAEAESLYPPDAHGPRSNLALMDAAALIQAREVKTGLERAITALERHPDAATAGRASLTGQILRTLPPEARRLPAARELQALTASA